MSRGCYGSRMRGLPESSFLFVTCQVGAEGALKREVGRVRPDLRFAYSRPGFVTFKATAGTIAADVRLESVIARAYGVSIGACEGEGDVVARAEAWRGERALRLHVFERDRWKPGDEPPDARVGVLAGEARRAIVAAAPAGLFATETEAREGELVADVIVAADEKWWLGCHVHHDGHSPLPGGIPSIALPGDAPSRAYLKMEEALLWSTAPVRAGDVAVEIGAAPGGASYALLRRGVRVVGIDPADVDPVLARFTGDRGEPLFTHVRAPAGGVPREALPPRVQWIALDVHLAPPVALRYLRKIVAARRRSLLGVLVTLKLNDWKWIDDVPRWVEEIRAMGLETVRARQLATNRQEVFVYGETRAGARRRRR